jgi:predicted nucleotidyltransferase
MATKDREQVLAFLRAHKDELRTRFGVTRLGLVGSYARDEARDESDIDIVVSLHSDNTCLEYEAFAADRKTYSATLREFIVIGEAIANIPDEVKTSILLMPGRVG